MNILNSSAFKFFKNFEKNAETFYYRTIKGNFSGFKLKLKIRGLLKTESRKKLTATQKIEIRSFYKQHNIENINTDWHEFYSDCNGIFDVRYVPENLFYVNIEPALNSTLFFPAMSDKNLIEKLFPNVKQPESVIKNINGFYYQKGNLISFDEAVENCSIPGKMVIKPTIDSWGGKNVLLFSGQNDDSSSNNMSISNLLANYKKNFIVQKVVEQHPVMSSLNSTSLNTLRVMTFLKDTEITVLSIVVRIGRKGTFTDNATTGGIPCGVKSDGSLNEIGFNLSGKPFTMTDSGIKLKDVQLPFMDKIKKTVKTLHASMPYFRIISWDLAIDVNGDIILIEHNDIGQDINFHQLNNGPVLAPLIEEYGKIIQSRKLDVQV